MKLIDAMRLANAPAASGAEPFRVLLCCGFTPLHLQTFLAAHLRQRLSERSVQIDTAPYGSSLATLESADLADYQVVCVVVEWADLDSRLGYRQLGGWGSGIHDDVAATVGERLRRFGDVVIAAAARRPVVFCSPTLPLPPMSHTVRAQSAAVEAELLAIAQDGVRRLVGANNVSVVSRQFLDSRSPFALRLDVKSELTAGFPYRVAHADAVAEALAALAVPNVPKKGLITDLDDTFWAGLVGEVGADQIRFDLDTGTQIHAIYQQFLSALSEAGVLVAVASRNDPSVVARALVRADLLMPRDRLFPVEVHWGEKSESVRRILTAWNVAADAVVVVDDSVRELEEIRAGFPGAEYRRFPGVSDPDGVMALLDELRDLFGRPRIMEEDAIRAATLRTRMPDSERPSGPSADFIASAEAELTVDLDPAQDDGRALALVNKTNQFNLNGRRYTAAGWQDATRGDAAFAMVVAYRDRFGPLGRIAVLAGRRGPDALDVSTWVLSCRAFARHIEHRCVAVLFDRFKVPAIHFDFAATARNGPARDFFTSLLGREPDGPFVLTRSEFEARCPALHQSVHVNV